MSRNRQIVAIGGQPLPIPEIHRFHVRRDSTRKCGHCPKLIGPGDHYVHHHESGRAYHLDCVTVGGDR